MRLVSSLLQGEDILKGKEKKGLKMDNRACPKCKTPITKALSDSVGREREGGLTRRTSARTVLCLERQRRPRRRLRRARRRKKSMM